MSDLENAERKEWSDDQGSMTLVRLPPRLGIIIPTGRVGEGAANFWAEHFEWLLVEETLLFFDAWELTFPKARFISIGSPMTINTRPRLAEFHVLVSSTMIEMVAKTISMSMGGFMVIHRHREGYEEALGAAVALQRAQRS